MSDKTSTSNPPPSQDEYDSLKSKLHEDNLSSDKRVPKQIKIHFENDPQKKFWMTERTNIPRYEARKKNSNRKSKKSDAYNGPGENVGIGIADGYVNKLESERIPVPHRESSPTPSPEFTHGESIIKNGKSVTSPVDKSIAEALFGAHGDAPRGDGSKISIAEVGGTSADKKSENNGITESKKNGLTFQRDKSTSESNNLEYVSPTQNDELSAILTGIKKNRKINLIIHAVVLFIAFAAELGFYISGSSGGAATASAVISVAVSSACLVFLRKEILSAFWGLLNRRPTASLGAVVPTVVCLIYNAAVFVSSLLNADSTPAASVPCAAALLFYSTALYLESISNLDTFNTVSSPEKKYAVVKLREGRRSAEDPDKLYEISSALFVDKTFEQGRKKSITSRRVGITVALAVLLSVGVGVTVGISTHNAVFGLGYFVLALSCSSAAPILICVSLPSYFARRRAAAYDAALIGEAAEDDYSDVPMILIEDADLFPAVGIKIRDLKIYGSQPLDYVLYKTASALTLTNSSLSDIFASMLHHERDLPFSLSKAIFIRQAENGFIAAVEGGEITIGNSDFLRSHGIEPIFDKGDNDSPRNGTVMYVAESGKVLLKFKICYQPDREIVDLIRRLGRSGIAVGITTCDPNINDETLSTALRQRVNDHSSARILRRLEKSGLRHRITENRQTSGIVSTHSAEAALRALAICGRSAQIRRLSFAAALLSSAVGAVLSIILALTGVPISAVLPLLPILYALFWSVPICVIAINN